MTTAYITHPIYTKHNLPGHPEHAGRIQSVRDTLEQAGLTEQMNCLIPQIATDDQILAVHHASYLDILKKISQQPEDTVIMLDNDTYLLPKSPDIARLSVGGVCLAIDEVMSNRADNALAAVRPPGHHAIPSRGMGFCILNNIAIAAQYAQQTYGVNRIMIVDYDVHHGNGTQDIFYDDDRVLFISTHQYPYYPGTGSFEETGYDQGKGFTINIPLSHGHGDQNYARIFSEIIRPAAKRYQPELILVSAGFDAHWVDPLASMKLSLNGYAHITRELIDMARNICGGKIVFVMEGGYDLTALGHGIRNIAHSLLDQDKISDPLGSHEGKEPDISQLISRLQSLHNLSQ